MLAHLKLNPEPVRMYLNLLLWPSIQSSNLNSAAQFNESILYITSMKILTELNKSMCKRSGKKSFLSNPSIYKYTHDIYFGIAIFNKK